MNEFEVYIVSKDYLALLAGGAGGKFPAVREDGAKTIMIRVMTKEEQEKEDEEMQPIKEENRQRILEEASEK